MAKIHPIRSKQVLATAAVTLKDDRKLEVEFAENDIEQRHSLSFARNEAVKRERCARNCHAQAHEALFT